jgi:hypothetical protein
MWWTPGNSNGNGLVLTGYPLAAATSVWLMVDPFIGFSFLPAL